MPSSSTLTLNTQQACQEESVLLEYFFQNIFCICVVVAAVVHGDYAFKRKLLTAVYHKSIRESAGNVATFLLHVSGG